MITDDAELAARAVIMSGAYEHNWRKHLSAQAAPLPIWQTHLPVGKTGCPFTIPGCRTCQLQ